MTIAPYLQIQSHILVNYKSNLFMANPWYIYSTFKNCLNILYKYTCITRKAIKVLPWETACRVIKSFRTHSAIDFKRTKYAIHCPSAGTTVSPEVSRSTEATGMEGPTPQVVPGSGLLETSTEILHDATASFSHYKWPNSQNYFKSERPSLELFYSFCFWGTRCLLFRMPCRVGAMK